MFISYVNTDREHAQRFARALERQGWTVWWDRTIVPGSDWQSVIEKALASASCAVVLWSQRSVASDWVRAEADDARQRGILVPVRLDDARIPLAFRHIQAANLEGWNGKAAHEGFAALVQGIRAVLARSTATERNEPPSETSMAPRAAIAARQRWRFRTPPVSAKLGVVARTIGARLSQFVSAGRRRSLALLQIVNLRRAAVCCGGVALVAFVLLRGAAVGKLWASVVHSRPLGFKLLAQIQPGGAMEGMAFSPDGRFLAVASTSQTCIWSVKEGTSRRCFVTSVSTPEWLTAQLIRSGSDIFDISKTDKAPVIRNVEAAQLSPDGTLLAFGVVNSGPQVLRFPTLEDPSTTTTVDHTRTLSIFDVAKDSVSCTVQAGSSTTRLWSSLEIAWSPRGDTVETVTEIKGEDDRAPTGDSDPLGFLRKPGYLRIPRLLANYWDTSCSKRNSQTFSQPLLLCDRTDWKTLQRVSVGCGRKVSPDGQYYGDFRDVILKSSNDEIAAHFEGTFLSWGPEPNEFSVRAGDNVIQVFSVTGKTPQHKLVLPFGIESTAASADGKHFAIRLYNGTSTTYFWDAESNKVLAKVPGLTGSQIFAAGGSLLSVYDSGIDEVRVLDGRFGRELAKIRTWPTVSADGLYVAGVAKQGGNDQGDRVSIWGVVRRLW